MIFHFEIDVDCLLMIQKIINSSVIEGQTQIKRKPAGVTAPI